MVIIGYNFLENDHCGVVRMKCSWEPATERWHWVGGQRHESSPCGGRTVLRVPLSGEEHTMDYGGFEQVHNMLEYGCPARYAGVSCTGILQCPVSDAVRIRLQESARVHTAGALKLCLAGLLLRAHRGRADQQPFGRRRRRFGFEGPGIRGLAKMQLRATCHHDADYHAGQARSALS